MICRIWRGWTTVASASVYEELLRSTVIPGIEARAIPGFRSIDMMRRDIGDEVEFTTIIWFDDLAAVKAFVGDDHEIAHVPQAARATLSRYDERAASGVQSGWRGPAEFEQKKEHHAQRDEFDRVAVGADEAKKALVAAVAQAYSVAQSVECDADRQRDDHQREE